MADLDIRDLSVTFRSTMGTLGFAEDIYDEKQQISQQTFNENTKKKIDDLDSTTTKKTDVPITKGTGTNSMISQGSNIIGQSTAESSIAFGNYIYSKGIFSNAEGNRCVAEGPYSKAFGYYTVALGNTAVALAGAAVGTLTVTYVNSKTITIDATTVYDILQLLLNQKTYFWINGVNVPYKILTITTVDNVITITTDNEIPSSVTKITIPYAVAKGSYSVSMRGIAAGTASFVANTQNYAGGQHSAAFGEKNIVQNSHEFAIGRFNKTYTSTEDSEATMFSIGNGTSPTNRYNIFEIRKNGSIKYVTLEGTISTLQEDLYNFEETLGTAYNNADQALAKANDAETAANNANETIQSVVKNSVTGGQTEDGTSLSVSSNNIIIPMASSSTAGVVKLTDSFTTMSGYLLLNQATQSDIVAKEDYFKPLTSSNVDDIVRVGITTNAQQLSSEEKSSAQKWLGLGEWVGTQAEYDALTVFDENVKYYIV